MVRRVPRPVEFNTVPMVRTVPRPVEFKTPLTPFADETGDDYGLGAGLCEDAQDGSVAEDAYVGVERTRQELAQNACVGLERSG
jgi:hypothetical protein